MPKTEKMNVVFINPNKLQCATFKKFSRKEIEQAVSVLKRFGFQCPVVIDNEYNVVVGDILSLLRS